MKKHFLALAVLLCLHTFRLSAQDFIPVNLLFNLFYWNPAAAGAKDRPVITTDAAIGRPTYPFASDHTSFQSGLAYEQPVKCMHGNIGIQYRYNNWEETFNLQHSLSLAYNCRFNLGKESWLSAGAQINWYRFTMQDLWISFETTPPPAYTYVSDGASANAGVFYTYKKFRAGIAVQDIAATKFSLFHANGYRFGFGASKPHALKYVSAAYEFNFLPTWQFTPTVMVINQHITNWFVINGTLGWNKRIEAGFSYERRDKNIVHSYNMGTNIRHHMKIMGIAYFSEYENAYQLMLQYKF